MPQDGVIATEQTDVVSEPATVVEFWELPAPEQSILRTAIEMGVVRACMDDGGEQADALRSFANRVTENSSYLTFEGDLYALWVRILDEGFAGTASAPEDDQNPCC